MPNFLKIKIKPQGKRFYLLFMIMATFIIAGCTLDATKYYVKNWELNKEDFAFRGDVILWKESGTKSEYRGYIIQDLKQELIYEGKENDFIKIKYKEYEILSNGIFLKEEFTKDLLFDISESKTITFQKAKIDIIEADDFQIKYVVVRDWY